MSRILHFSRSPPAPPSGAGMECCPQMLFDTAQSSLRDSPPPSGVIHAAEDFVRIPMRRT
ncbi:Hypothetical protein A7982_11831 [Minicystis rosea]|nr:Hypothetical protein A7982_11831 [Minicystis rosea]